uniref:ARAD1D34584p n=1 Tax=Blastobotrys adeninivorans TaxID=409370 RepID=A0A060TC99_BLAAD
MNELGTSPQSPPTRTSLAAWWKQFKQKHNEQDEGPLLGTSPRQSGGGGIPSRPQLRHMSHSSSAIGTTRGASGASGSSDHSQPNLAIPAQYQESPIFGVPLAVSIQYAKVSISLSDPSGDQFVYGYIPIVVAKCGVFLKKNATTVEGIFRLSGSARRIKELQSLFNSPPRFGKGLDWSGYNVHDAANVLRRYLNNLPEPIVPLNFYERFRDPLREYSSIVEVLDAQSGPAVRVPSDKDTQLEEKKDQDDEKIDHQKHDSPEQPANSGTGTNSEKPENPPTDPSSGGTDATKAESKAESTNESNSGPSRTSPKVDEQKLSDDSKNAIEQYQKLIAQLPSLNRQLLMYILDLLSIFAAKSDENRMPASNLAAIFQPSILSHPSHDMAPEEYHLSRAAIEFLIQHSNKFLSHIEAIAIKQHEDQKRNRSTSQSHSQPQSIPSDHPLLTVSNAEKRERFKHHSHQTHHGSAPNAEPMVRRRHSKSLSSVGTGPPPVPNGKFGPSRQQHNHHHTQPSSPQPQSQQHQQQQQQQQSLIVPKQRVASPSKETPLQEQSSQGLISSIKRSVSLSRRGSQKGNRNSSVSSAGSSHSPVPSSSRRHTADSGSPAGIRSPSSPDIPEENATGTGTIPAITATNYSSASVNSSDTPQDHSEGDRRHSKLTTFFAKRSRSPGAGPPLDSPSSTGAASPDSTSKSVSSGYFDQHHPASSSSAHGAVVSPNASIDQTLAAASPPPTTTGGPSSQLGTTESPRTRLSAFALATHNNESSSSIAKTVSGSSADMLADDSDDEASNSRHGPGVRSRRHLSPDRANVSKWRRSLMVFNMGSNSNLADDLAESDGDGSMPVGSPSKVGAWFRKMKSKEKNIGHIDE